MPRFEKCPKCFGTDVEILGEKWICWDCDWEEPLNEQEKKGRSENGKE